MPWLRKAGCCVSTEENENFVNAIKGASKALRAAYAFIFWGLRPSKRLENGKITARQIEAARIAMTRCIKRGGQVGSRFFPDKPITKKPAEVRMGKGKGAVELYVAHVRAGRIYYEIMMFHPEVAKEALKPC